MPKVGIGTDEWYPVYDIEEGEDYEVPQGLIDRCKIVFDEFFNIQNELEAIYSGRKD